MKARVARFGVFAGLAALLLPVGVSASSGSTPTVSSVDGISSQPVLPGSTIVVHGNHFSNDVFPGDCGIAGPPLVVFRPFPDPNNGANEIRVQPANTGSAQCSNTMARVTVPSGIQGGGAFIYVVDPQGHTNDISAPNPLPMITLPISVNGPNPNSGQVGTSVTLSGALKPVSAVANSLNVLVGGVSVPAQSWDNSGIRFAPGNRSGSVSGSMTVITDYNLQSHQANLAFGAASYTFHPPSLSTTHLDHVHVGDRVSISGANLGPGGGVSFSPGLAGGSIAWGSGQIGVTVPAGAQDGTVTVSVNGWGNVASSLTATLAPLVTGTNPDSGSAGGSISVAGYNFGSDPGTVKIGDAEQQVSKWSDGSVTFVLSPDTDPGTIDLTRADGLSAGGPSINIVPKLTKLESNNVAAGAQVLVDGVSLGSQPGTATIGTKTGTILLWSRNTILVQLPNDIKAGTYPLTVKSALGTVSNALQLVIIPAPPSPSPGSKTTPSPGDHPSPVYDENHRFVKPIQPPSPVSLSITADPHETNAGSVASLLVTLKLNGKPVSGADIKLSMLYSPGSDYEFTPASGTTDANGTFKATVRVSKKPGDSIILAESGVFSDQDHVLGKGQGVTGAAPGLNAPNPAAFAGALPYVGLGALAVILLGVGALINIRSMGSGRWL